nr:unnamed protein product [Callosobruchus analis]
MVRTSLVNPAHVELHLTYPMDGTLENVTHTDAESLTTVPRVMNLLAKTNGFVKLMVPGHLKSCLLVCVSTVL